MFHTRSCCYDFVHPMSGFYAELIVWLGAFANFGGCRSEHQRRRDRQAIGSLNHCQRECSLQYWMMGVNKFLSIVYAMHGPSAGAGSTRWSVSEVQPEIRFGALKCRLTWETEELQHSVQCHSYDMSNFSGRCWCCIVSLAVLLCPHYSRPTCLFLNVIFRANKFWWTRMT